MYLLILPLQFFGMRCLFQIEKSINFRLGSRSQICWLEGIFWSLTSISILHFVFLVFKFNMAWEHSIRFQLSWLGGKDGFGLGHCMLVEMGRWNFSKQLFFFFFFSNGYMRIWKLWRLPLDHHNGTRRGCLQVLVSVKTSD